MGRSPRSAPSGPSIHHSGEGTQRDTGVLPCLKTPFAPEAKRTRGHPNHRSSPLSLRSRGGAAGTVGTQGTDVPLFLSHQTLAGRRSLPRALGPWALDSGGFTEPSLHGRWTLSAKDYQMRSDATQIRWRPSAGCDSRLDLVCASPPEERCVSPPSERKWFCRWTSISAEPSQATPSSRHSLPSGYDCLYHNLKHNRQAIQRPSFDLSNEDLELEPSCKSIHP